MQIVWDSFSTRDKEEKYKLKSKLPGIKAELGSFATRDEAKARVESVLKYCLPMPMLQLITNFLPFCPAF